MEAPTVKTVFRDPERDVTYEILAYRQLTREEAIMGTRSFFVHWSRSRQHKRKNSLRAVPRDQRAVPLPLQQHSVPTVIQGVQE